MEVRVEDRGPSRLHLGPSTFIRRLRRENWNGKIIIRKRGKRKEKIVLTEKKRENEEEREREREACSFFHLYVSLISSSCGLANWFPIFLKTRSSVPRIWD